MGDNAAEVAGQIQSNTSSGGDCDGGGNINVGGIGGNGAGHVSIDTTESVQQKSEVPQQNQDQNHKQKYLKRVPPPQPPRAPAEHIELADRIKSHHCHLRKATSEGATNGEDDWTIWRRHLEHNDALRAYASAMEKLATKYWAPGGPGSRIEWCRAAALEYYRSDGGGTLERALAKDARRAAFKHWRAQGLDQEAAAAAAAAAAKSAILLSQTATERQQTINKACNSTTSTSSSGGGSSSSCSSATTGGIAAKRPKRAPLRLLDVGSCYNAFAEFKDEFATLAIDIAPANMSVQRCDFLSVAITPNGTVPGENADSKGQSHSSSSSSSCTSISTSISTGGGGGCGGGGDVSGAQINLVTSGDPSLSSNDLETRRPALQSIGEAAFDVVTFNLLLTYIPTPKLRRLACLQARRCLRLNGLLLIVAPDSRHVGKGVAWMKAWRTSLEHSGFRRCRYEKLENLHCMGYRATMIESPPAEEEENKNTAAARPSEAQLDAMFWIPHEKG